MQGAEARDGPSGARVVDVFKLEGDRLGRRGGDELNGIKGTLRQGGGDKRHSSSTSDACGGGDDVAAHVGGLCLKAIDNWHAGGSKGGGGGGFAFGFGFWCFRFSRLRLCRLGRCCRYGDASCFASGVEKGFGVPVFALCTGITSATDFKATRE